MAPAHRYSGVRRRKGKGDAEGGPTRARRAPPRGTGRVSGPAIATFMQLARALADCLDRVGYGYRGEVAHARLRHPAGRDIRGLQSRAAPAGGARATRIRLILGEPTHVHRPTMPAARERHRTCDALSLR